MPGKAKKACTHPLRSLPVIEMTCCQSHFKSEQQSKMSAPLRPRLLQTDGKKRPARSPYTGFHANLPDAHIHSRPLYRGFNQPEVQFQFLCKHPLKRKRDRCFPADPGSASCIFSLRELLARRVERALQTTPLRGSVDPTNTSPITATPVLSNRASERLRPPGK